MDAGGISLIAGAVAVVISALFVLIRGLGENKNQSIANKSAIDKRIDERVKAQLEEAWQQIDEQGTKIEQLQKDKRVQSDILRRWFLELSIWDRRGRRGGMPLPTPEDMIKLDLELIETTLTSEEVRTLTRSNHNDEI